MRSYRYDSQQQIFICPDHEEFSYSDGVAVEERLFSVIRHATDVSSSSQLLVDAIEDWPSEYHLSPTRHNLLRFLGLGATHRILELGCGCGAMTRFLGESGATVVAVEGSRLRAQIAAARCRDLPNVTVYCDNLINFEFAEKFDFVTLIGVLEYAPKFIEADDPVGRCLGHARSFLKADGALVLAIENQLGLKYFNGQAEDHVGISYYGINDLYGKTDPITFGRHVLSDKLRAAGFPVQDFFYPFPDYKLPGLILSEAAFCEKGLNVADLLHRAVSRDHTGQARSAFYEPLAWRSVAHNQLVPHLANSFLVLAAVNERRVPESRQPWLARTYAAERKPEYATETICHVDEEGLRVTKQPMYPDHAAQDSALPKGRLLHRVPLEDNYVTGNLYIGELQILLARGADIEQVARWAHEWIQLLCRNTVPDSDGTMLDGEWMDAIPANFIRNAAGDLVWIDKEWDLSYAIPLDWVLIRGLVNSLAVCPTSPALSQLSYRQVIEKTLAMSGVRRKLTDESFAVADQHEADLRALVYGTAHPLRVLSEMLGQPAACAIGGQMLQDESARLQSEIWRIKSTVSWRITKPLRLLANLPSIISTALRSNTKENGQ